MGGLFGDDPLEPHGARHAARRKRDRVAVHPTTRTSGEPFAQRVLVAVERGVDAYPEGLTYGVPAPISPTTRA